MCVHRNWSYFPILHVSKDESINHGDQPYSGSGSSLPLTIRISIMLKIFYTSQNIKVHKNYVVSLDKKAWKKESWGHFTFWICASQPNDMATHLKWSLGDGHFRAVLVDIYKLATWRLAKPKLYILNKIQYTFWAMFLFFSFSWTISSKAELISAIISLSKLVRSLSPASNNLKGKYILSIT